MNVAWAFQFVGFVVLPALAVVFLTTAAIGTRDPRAPRCGSCREALGFAEMALGKPCRACGATVADRAPAPSRRRPARSSLVVGVVCLLCMVPAIWMSTMLSLRPATFAPSIALVPTLMAATSSSSSQLGSTVAAVRAGEISHADLRAAMAAALANAPATLQTVSTLELAAVALEDRDASPEALAAHWDLILRAAFAPASPAPAFLQTKNPSLVLDPTREPSSLAPLGRVAVLRGAWIDGEEVPLDEFVAFAPTADAPIALPVTVRPFSGGQHTLRVAIETFLYTRFDLERTGAREARRLAESDWPTPLARRVDEFAVTITSP